MRIQIVSKPAPRTTAVIIAGQLSGQKSVHINQMSRMRSLAVGVFVYWTLDADFLGISDLVSTRPPVELTGLLHPPGQAAISYLAHTLFMCQSIHSRIFTRLCDNNISVLMAVWWGGGVACNMHMCICAYLSEKIKPWTQIPHILIGKVILLLIEPTSFCFPQNGHRHGHGPEHGHANGRPSGHPVHLPAFSDPLRRDQRLCLCDGWRSG